MYDTPDFLAPTRDGLYGRRTTAVNRYHDHVDDLVDRFMDGDEPVRVLDVGPSSGAAIADTVDTLTAETGREYKIHVADPASLSVERCADRDGIDGTVRAAGQALPYQKDTFDLAVCHRLLPFISVDDRFAVLREMDRVTSRDATFMADLLVREEPDTRVTDDITDLYIPLASYAAVTGDR